VTTLLDVRELSVRYGPVAAVRGISFHVDDGELVALVGPNGAGKTTTLACLAGLRPRDAGEVAFRGQPVAGKAPEELVGRGMALVPEGRHIFGSLSVRENLELGASSRRFDDAARADLEWVLELFPRLGDFLGRPAGSLSGGEQQQLAIGRALMARPRLLMLDEPSLGLAPLIVQHVFDTIEALRSERDMAVLLVEQNARAATEMADRTYVLRQGRVTLAGTREELANDERFETAFLGF
jgi:branched-chain amino acid transport system ATP-binding protein